MIIDIAIFSLFLALNLAIGLWYGRKVKTLKQYAIGDKKFSTGTITATIVATSMGGGALFYGICSTYTQGITFILTDVIAVFLSYWLSARLVVIRMGEFMHTLSVAEAIGTLYGKVVRIMAAFIHTLLLVGLIAGNFRSITHLVGLVWEIEGYWITLIIGSIVVVYSVFGGIRSVVLTDVFQLIIICICLLTFILTLYHNCQHPTPIITTLTTHLLFSWKSFQESMGWNQECIGTFSLFLCLAFPHWILHPIIFQRIVISHNIDQARKAFTYAALFSLLLMLGLVLLGILVWANNPTLNPNELVPYCLAKAANYPMLKGLLAICVVAMGMSTADSLLNSAALFCVNDIIKPLQRTAAKQKKLKHELSIARICSFGIGLLAMLLTIQFNITKVLMYTQNIHLATIVPPLCLAILGFRSTPTALFCAMAAGITTQALWYYFFSSTKIDNNIINVLANGLVLFISHFLLPKPKEKAVGWVGIQDKAPLLEDRRIRKQAWKKWIAQIRTFQLYAYCQRLVPETKITYPAFAFYALFIIYIPLLKLHTAFCAPFPTLYAITFISVLIFIAAFVTYPTWPPPLQWKPFITFFWPIGVGYILFCASTIVLITSGFQHLPLTVWIANLLSASLLMPWQVVCIMFILGTTLALSLISWLANELLTCLTAGCALEFKMIYGTILLFCLLVMIYKHHQEKLWLQHAKAYQKRLTQASETDRWYHWQYQAYFKALFSMQKEPFQFVKHALHTLEKTNKDQKIIQKALEQCDAYIDFQKRNFHYTMDYLHLQVEPIAVDELLEQLITSLKSAEFYPKVRFRVNTQHKTLFCDITKINQLLVTSLQQLEPFMPPANLLLLSIQDTSLSYPLQAIQDPSYKKKLPALGLILSSDSTICSLAPTYPGNTGELHSKIPHNIAALPQYKNERIIDAHYGYHETIQTPSGMHLLYVLPVDVRSIRASVVDELPATNESPLEDAASLALEAEFLSQVKAKTPTNLAIIQDAIAYIKKVHQGQLRKSGELFYTHPITVAGLVLTMTQDPDALIAALLHDAVEDTAFRLDQAAYQYGQEVAFIVSKVTHLDPTDKKTKLTEEENQYQLSATQDPRVVMVKLADRWHNLNTMGYQAIEKQRHVAQETLHFYVPLGRKLGLAVVDALVDKIEMHCQQVLHACSDQ